MNKDFRNKLDALINSNYDLTRYVLENESTLKEQIRPGFVPEKIAYLMDHFGMFFTPEQIDEFHKQFDLYVNSQLHQYDSFYNFNKEEIEEVMSSVLENYPEQSFKETDIETLTNLIDKYENKINPSVINDIKGLIISINVKLGKKPYQNELRQLKKQDEKFQLKTGAIIDANLDLVDYTLNHLSTAKQNFSTEYFDKQLQSIKEITPNLIIDILENVKDNYKYNISLKQADKHDELVDKYLDSYVYLMDLKYNHFVANHKDELARIEEKVKIGSISTKDSKKLEEIIRNYSNLYPSIIDAVKELKQKIDKKLGDDSGEQIRNKG